MMYCITGTKICQNIHFYNSGLLFIYIYIYENGVYIYESQVELKIVFMEVYDKHLRTNNSPNISTLNVQLL